MAPLDAAGRAAHEGELGRTFGRRKLPTALRATLVDFFVAKGWSIVDVPYDVDASDEAGGWEPGRQNGVHISQMRRARQASRKR